MTRENIPPREDILRMSREAGLNMGTIQQYERFTQLVANALAALQSAALREELDLIPDAGKMVGPQRQPLASEGWQLVPVEPTPEMISAGFAQDDDNTLSWIHPAQAYHAALKVAPKPPPRRPLTDEELYKLRTDAARYRKLVAMEAALVEPVMIWHYLRNPDDLDTAHDIKEQA